MGFFDLPWLVGCLQLWCADMAGVLPVAPGEQCSPPVCAVCWHVLGLQ